MNRSWSKNCTSSPGFVYFSKESDNGPEDTSEFLSFESSPKQNYNKSPCYGSPKFHSSPRQFNHRNNYRYSGRNRGNRSYNSPNNSYHSWSNNKYSKRHMYKDGMTSNNSTMMSADGKRNISGFYDPECTSNPWAELEKQLDIDKTNEKSLESSPIPDNEKGKVEQDEHIEKPVTSSNSSDGGTDSSTDDSKSSSSSEEEEEDGTT